jgi:hypothetical protein
MNTTTQHCILKTRLANPKDIDAIWNLYLKTNYLYPEKLFGMGDNGKTAKKNLEKLLSCDYKTFCICLCEDSNKELLAVCSHGLFAQANDWIMHMTCNHNLKALIEVFKTLRSITKASLAEWISWTFRPDNHSIKRLFLSVMKSVDETEIENTIYDYYQVKSQSLKNLTNSYPDLEIRKSTESDRQFVIAQLSNHSDKIALRSYGQFNQDFSLKSVSGKLNEIGFTRARTAWTVEENGAIGGIVIADVSPDWWNTSNLSTGLRFFLLKPNRQVISSLLSAGTEWLDQFPIPCWTMLLPPHEILFKDFLENLRITPKKQYQRLTMNRVLADTIYDGYEGFMRRSQGGNNEYLHHGI